MPSGTVDLKGKVVNAAGAAKVGLTVNLYKAADWETFAAGGADTITATTTTATTTGLWAFNGQDITQTWVVAVLDGTKTFIIDARNEVQFTELDVTDAVSVDIIREHTSAAGVTVDGLLIKDSEIPISGLDIDGGTDIGAALVDADLIIVDDGAGGTNRKSALSRLKTYIAEHVQ